jgi:hypothetical protein
MEITFTRDAACERFGIFGAERPEFQLEELSPQANGGVALPTDRVTCRCAFVDAQAE